VKWAFSRRASGSKSLIKCRGWHPDAGVSSKWRRAGKRQWRSRFGVHGVWTGVVESLDAQMMLEPFEEQFHLPASNALASQTNWSRILTSRTLPVERMMTVGKLPWMVSRAWRLSNSFLGRKSRSWAKTVRPSLTGQKPPTGGGTPSGSRPRIEIEKRPDSDNRQILQS
jgi:hypothetical protein